jgi:hypothetical protein
VIRGVVAAASLAIGLLVCACGSGCRRTAATDGDRSPLPPAATGYSLTIEDPSPPLEYHGVSDLARDDAGTFWIVDETGTERHLVPLQLGDGGAPVVLASKILSIHVDPALDSESLALLPGPRFAVGTEGSGGRRSEAILLFDPTGSPAGSWTYRYPVDRSVDNHGIEAMCAIGSSVLVAIEQHVEASDRPPFPGYVRAALVDGDRQRDGRFYVTSDDGILSGMACRPGASPDTFELVAIESRRPRTKKSRLLHATLTVRDDFAVVPDGWWVDLNGTYGEPAGVTSPQLNFEGVAWAGDGSWLLVNDDQLKGHPGAAGTHLFRLRPK